MNYCDLYWLDLVSLPYCSAELFDDDDVSDLLHSDLAILQVFQWPCHLM